MRFAAATVLLFPALIAAAPQSEVQSSAAAARPATAPAGQCSNNAPVQCCDNTRKMGLEAVTQLLNELGLPIPLDLGKAPTVIPGDSSINDATNKVPAAPGTDSSGAAAAVPATGSTDNAAAAVPATANTEDVDGQVSAGGANGRVRGGRGRSGNRGNRGGRGRGGNRGGRPSRHNDDYDYDYDDEYYNKAKRALLDGLNLDKTLNLGNDANVLQKIDILNKSVKILNQVFTLVGTGCSPIGLINTCKASQQSVCCQNNEFNGLVNVGCTPINVNVL